MEKQGELGEGVTPEKTVAADAIDGLASDRAPSDEKKTETDATVNVLDQAQQEPTVAQPSAEYDLLGFSSETASTESKPAVTNLLDFTTQSSTEESSQPSHTPTMNATLPGTEPSSTEVGLLDFSHDTAANDGVSRGPAPFQNHDSVAQPSSESPEHGGEDLLDPMKDPSEDAGSSSENRSQSKEKLPENQELDKASAPADKVPESLLNNQTKQPSQSASFSGSVEVKDRPAKELRAQQEMVSATSKETEKINEQAVAPPTSSPTESQALPLPEAEPLDAGASGRAEPDHPVSPAVKAKESNDSGNGRVLDTSNLSVTVETESANVHDQSLAESPSAAPAEVAKSSEEGTDIVPAESEPQRSEMDDEIAKHKVPQQAEPDTPSVPFANEEDSEKGRNDGANQATQATVERVDDGANSSVGTDEAAAAAAPPIDSAVKNISTEKQCADDTAAKKSPKQDEPISSSSKDDATAEVIAQLQASLDDQVRRRTEAEEKAKHAEERVAECEEKLEQMAGLEEEIERLNENIVELVSEKSNLEFELSSMEQSRDEHERKANVLSNRLNAAKKKEGVKANLAEQLEEENVEFQSQLETLQNDLATMSTEKESLELEMEALKKKCVDRVKAAELSLEEEQRLNEERKKKMKLFIESKADELRVAKAHNDELQVEVEQTQISLRETNDRWKQLHAQWVQSQTRNRELQRDLNRIKKDSDNLHKIGDNLEMKLSRSAQETEEHKNKRLTAKHELMTILRTLEAERSVSGKLRDSIKFTFTPKALSQQQLLKESLQDFEAELVKLARRVGKPLPPPPTDSPHFHDNGGPISPPKSDEVTGGGAVNDGSSTDESGTDGGKKNRSEIDSNHLLSNLENETQRVSQCIMALISNVERMNVLLHEGDRTCMTALSDLLTGVQSAQQSSHEETTSITGAASPRTRLGMGPYASVPHS